MSKYKCSKCEADLNIRESDSLVKTVICKECGHVEVFGTVYETDINEVKKEG